MQKIFLYTLIVSLLFATAFAGTNNYRFNRFIQEIQGVDDAVIVTESSSSSDISGLNTASDLNNFNDMIVNTTIPIQPDNTTIVIDNTTAPILNVTIPLNNNTMYQPEKNLTQYLKVVGRANGKARFGSVLIGFTVETLDQQAAIALKNNSQIVTTTMDQIKSLGLDEGDITVSGIQVQPIYTLAYLNSQVTINNGTQSEEVQAQQQEAKQSLKFKVKNSFVVSTNKTELVGQILDSAMNNGVNYIDYVNYEPLGNDITTLKESLLEEALDNAERLAQKVIEKIGYELGSVRRVFIIDDVASPVVIGEESQSVWNDSQTMHQQLVEVHYAMTAPETQ